MKKSILVIDTPTLCADCPASKLAIVDHTPHLMCGVTGKLVPHEIKVSGFREGLCPAKPVSSSKWIKVGKHHYACSECNYDDMAVASNFCPNCGASMEG